jgi:hypothetical protein
MTMCGLLDRTKTTFQVTGPLISGDFTHVGKAHPPTRL